MSNYQNIVKSEMKAGNGTDRFSQQLRTAIWSPGVRKASLTQRMVAVVQTAGDLANWHPHVQMGATFTIVDL